MITFDEKLEAAWGLHKIEKAVLEKEVAELRAENEKLCKALLYVYDNSLGLDPDKITDDIEWVTKEIRTARKALENGDE